MNMNKKRMVIFDFDGTVVASMEYIDEMFKRLFAKQGIIPDDEMLSEIKPKGFSGGATYMKKEYHLDDSEEELVHYMLDEMSVVYQDIIQLKPHVVELLEWLSARDMKICLATANIRDFVKATVERTGIDQYLDYVITIDELKTTKDSPEIFLHCARKFHVEPKDCVVFEDSLSACQVAKEAGFYVIGVQDETNKGKERAEMHQICDIFIDDFSQVIRKLTY
ncbi:HAD family hydrolase [Dehalobacterium formicoaceticum]|uniref:HAD family phosphatase n=1 Tax=Dehalobacterium formicoaceticum TaxID=51515 RepID=A0ABT1Y0A4_9FIRM|nr:HAD family phosphatase [Dehalobacterium formicoaceticum]MCR6544304.1 HAD family phosphatase [Dehalobacterium formicoaceticum]